MAGRNGRGKQLATQRESAAVAPDNYGADLAGWAVAEARSARRQGWTNEPLMGGPEHLAERECGGSP